MDRITNGRRNIYIHGKSDVEDLPVTGEVELPYVRDIPPFTPAHQDGPTLYPGDVIAGVHDGEVRFAWVIADSWDDSVVVVPLTEGYPEAIDADTFASQFIRLDEIHIYGDIASEQAEPDVELDESRIRRPQTDRLR
jgi:hypothetical protein